jgi:hypothetical protein
VANHKISLGNLALAPGPVALTRGDLEATGGEFHPLSLPRRRSSSLPAVVTAAVSLTHGAPSLLPLHAPAPAPTLLTLDRAWDGENGGRLRQGKRPRPRYGGTTAAHRPSPSIPKLFLSMSLLFPFSVNFLFA